MNSYVSHRKPNLTLMPDGSIDADLPLKVEQVTILELGDKSWKVGNV